MTRTIDLSGVSPANITPMKDGGEAVHWEDLRAHIEELVAVDGVNGILCNGHAGEVHALTQEERLGIVETIDDVTDDDSPVITGVVGGSTTEYIERVGDANDAGADVILVVPPHTSVTDHHEAALTFFSDIADAVDIPLVVFQDPTWASGDYPPATLGELVTIDGVIGVKDAIWDVDHYQEDVRAIRDSGVDAQVMVANDEHMLPSLVLRSDGIFLELAAVITEHIVDLYEAVEESDIPRARAVYDSMEPFVDAMYEPPVGYSHTRLKVALELQGKIDSGVPRKPTMPIGEDERERIREAMLASGLEVA